MKSHKDLEVWKKTIALAKSVYNLTKDLPREETYALSDQMKRSVISVASNIAEGAGGLTATAISAASVSLGWTDNSNNETGFQLQRKTGSVCDNAGWTSIVNPAANITSYQNNNLSAATIYSYRIRATNANGSSAWSGCATATTFAAATVIPAAPSVLTATPGAAGQMVLNWTDNQPNDPASSEVRFQPQRKSGNVCDNAGWITTASTSTNVTTLTNTGLTTGNTYSWRVQAVNAAGSSAYSNCATAVAP